MAEIGLDVTHAITYLIRQSLRERIRTGKDTLHLRALLQDLDVRLAYKNTQTLPVETLDLQATDESLSATRKLYGKLSAEGKVKPMVVLHTETGERYQLPVNYLFKDSIEDLMALLAQPKHPLLVETIHRTRHITARIAGGFETEAVKLN
jgi:D-alanine-D-alanine ligase